MTTNEKTKVKSRISRVISSPYFEVRPKLRGVQIVVAGAVGISEVTLERILVKCHGIKLEICGFDLKVNVIESNTIEIVGIVEDIKFVNACN